MQTSSATIGETVLRFFGTMSAASTHEIKNALAIINESAGLLGDLSMMAAKGVELSPERLKRLSGTIMKQVRRADEMIRRLNRFAHTAGQFNISVDLPELLDYMSTFFAPLIERRGLRLETPPLRPAVSVTTSPIYLMNLIWSCLDRAMPAAGEKGCISLGVEKDAERIHIRFAGADVRDGEAGKPFSAGPEKDLLQILGANVRIEVSTGEMVLSLPKRS